MLPTHRRRLLRRNTATTGTSRAKVPDYEGHSFYLLASFYLKARLCRALGAYRTVVEGKPSAASVICFPFFTEHRHASNPPNC